MTTTGERRLGGWNRLTPVAASMALAAGALTLSGCEGGESASADTNNGTVATEVTETAPGVTPDTEISNGGAIDAETGDEIPQNVMELMQIAPEEFYQLTEEEQAIYHTWQLAHPFHVDTSNFQTTVLDGWNPHFADLDEAYNPLTNPADWNDSDEDIARKLKFMVEAVWAQVRLDEDEGLDYLDQDAAKKMLQLYYKQHFSQLDEEASSGRIVVDAIRAKLDFLEQIGDEVRPQQIEPLSFDLIPGTGEERTITNPDGEEVMARVFLATEQHENGDTRTYQVAVVKEVLPTYYGDKTAVWKIAELSPADFDLAS